MLTHGVSRGKHTPNHFPSPIRGDTVLCPPRMGLMRIGRPPVTIARAMGYRVPPLRGYPPWTLRRRLGRVSPRRRSPLDVGRAVVVSGGVDARAGARSASKGLLKNKNPCLRRGLPGKIGIRAALAVRDIHTIESR